jgi:hypothetical protein
VSALRITLALAAVLLGLASLLAAHDVSVWKDAAGGGRVGSTWLPGDPAGRVLALDDDVALRRGERTFGEAFRVEGFESDLERARKRAEAEAALSAAIDLGSARQASRAGNLLGILAATGSAFADPVEQQALGTFDAAIRADAENVDAKYNLELLFRRIVVVGAREGAGVGSGNRGEPRADAGAGVPGFGY